MKKINTDDYSLKDVLKAKLINNSSSLYTTLKITLKNI